MIQPYVNIYMNQWTKIAQALKEHNMQVSKGNSVTEFYVGFWTHIAFVG
jgi:hypothetical protein